MTTSNCRKQILQIVHRVFTIYKMFVSIGARLSGRPLSASKALVPATGTMRIALPKVRPIVSALAEASIAGRGVEG